MKRILAFILSGIMFLFVSVPSEEVKAQISDDRVGYSVQAILPENQRETGVSYFDLVVEAGLSQTLQVEIFNHEDTALEIQVTPTTASTNQNGLIVYDSQDEYDESLEYPISELVNLEANKVVVPANASQIIDIHLNIPEESFEGFLLGGLHFEKVFDEEESNSEGVQIQNRYAYVIGLQATIDEQNVEPNLKLVGIDPTLVNYRTAVVANIQNDQPRILGDVSISAEVYEADEEEPIKTAEMENVQFAPNSTMDFVINWENQPLEAGNYRLEMTATDGENSWEWQEDFEIKAEDEELNVQAVELEEESSPNWWILAGFIMLFIVIVALLIYIQRLKARTE